MATVARVDTRTCVTVQRAEQGSANPKAVSWGPRQHQARNEKKEKSAYHPGP